MRLKFWFALVAAILAGTGMARAAEMRVTLLGTGTPTPRLSSFSAATLVEAGPEKLIFDFGPGLREQRRQGHRDRGQSRREDQAVVRIRRRV
ncbi:phosphoribosyl 1,2-cyclic phosphodiesterase [Bradyrhizobium sp. USDA 3240]